MFARKKKAAVIQYNEYGMSLGMPRKEERWDSLFLCLSKSLVLFCIVFGSIGFYFSCFRIEYYAPLVGLGILIFSFLAGFLYYNSLTKNLGYVAALLLFGGMAFRYYAEANSGFAAILNQTYEVIDEEFILPALNIFSERISNRTYTVTICSLFLGFFACLFLNIIISGKLGSALLFFFGAPIYAMGLYFNGEAALWSIMLLAIGFLSVIIFNRECKIWDKKKCGYRKKKKKKGDRYLYYSDGKTMFGGVRQTALGCIVLSLLLFLMIPSRAINYPSSWRQLKQSVREDVRNYFIIGPAAFFIRNQGTGGMSRGRLGNVSSVRPDYEVDLNVTLVPYNFDRIYLKGYTGTEYRYRGDRWFTTKESGKYSTIWQDSQSGDGVSFRLYDMVEGEISFPDEGEVDLTPALIEKWYRENVEKDGLIYTKMRIENVDADTALLYAPYYTKVDEQENVTVFGDDEVWANFPKGSVREYDIYRVNGNVFDLEDEDSEWDREYRKYVKMNYLGVPDELSETLGRIWEEAELTGTKEEIAGKIIKYFEDNYSYTLRPGLLPWRTDFVEYFLDRNKKGYCAHFASAATLLFRYAGIPARYCEGYVIDYDQILEGEENEGESVSEWFDGELKEWDQSLVITAEVTDAEAHGWVEIYLDGYGWVPVETTPASSVDENYSSFMESFFGLFSNQNEGEEKNTAGNDVEDNRGGISIDNKVVIYVGIILLLASLSWFVQRFIKLRNEKNGKGKEGIRERIKGQYHYYQMILRTTKQHQMVNETLTEYRKRMTELFPDDRETRRWFDILEMVFYGYRDEYEEFEECENRLLERIKLREKEMTLKQWIGLYLF